jgi:hypothetical protein
MENTKLIQQKTSFCFPFCERSILIAMLKEPLPRKDKIDDYFGVSCYCDEKREYVKLKKGRESFSQMIRRIMNAAVEANKSHNQ